MVHRTVNLVPGNYPAYRTLGWVRLSDNKAVRDDAFILANFHDRLAVVYDTLSRDDDGFLPARNRTDQDVT